ncbi:hypothetical protein [Rhizobium leguminosarum]|uniref:hypothetical protein n=1 Tax=Rhizobium leguminosarum TaxID=384 RepID=UPI001C9429AC|nr:hypothetical protein [Rhizobium leguminosarum]MBY5416080.1 hypothetical protein [Rhizobium leguminosarum]
MSKRLRQPSIERVPKKVHHSKKFRISVDLKKTADLKKALSEIYHAIENGLTLPSGSYRANVATTRDELLDTYGIMHLHLGSDRTRELLYLVQYSKYVVFLEVTDHIHFESVPVGNLLIQQHSKALADLSEQIAAQELSELEEKTVAIRNSLLRRRKSDGEVI